MVFAGHLPDVEGLGGGVGQQPEHEDDGVGVRKAVRVDLSAQGGDASKLPTNGNRDNRTETKLNSGLMESFIYGKTLPDHQYQEKTAY